MDAVTKGYTALKLIAAKCPTDSRDVGKLTKDLRDFKFPAEHLNFEASATRISSESWTVEPHYAGGAQPRHRSGEHVPFVLQDGVFATKAKAFPFMSLPAELRNVVYEDNAFYPLKWVTVTYHSENSTMNDGTGHRAPITEGDRVVAAVHEHPLLCVNKQIRDEAGSVASANWIVHVNTIDCLEIYLRNGSAKFLGLRKIFIDGVDIMPPRRIFGIKWDDLLSKCAHLETMYFELCLDCNDALSPYGSDVSRIKWFQSFVRQVHGLDKVPKMLFDCSFHDKADGAPNEECSVLLKFFDSDLWHIVRPVLAGANTATIRAAKEKLAKDFKFDHLGFTFLEQQTRLWHSFDDPWTNEFERVCQYEIPPSGLFRRDAIGFWETMSNYM